MRLLRTTFLNGGGRFLERGFCRSRGPCRCLGADPGPERGTHIRETVAAMQAQRYAGTFELLFADGGSEDRTRAILEELAAEDPRIRVLENPRRGTPSGLNVCLREARGEFVARMDAHTYYADRYLAAGVERLRRGDTDWVSGPAVPRPTGAVSRAVARALSSWLGRGGSRKWASTARLLRSASWTPGCSGACGAARWCSRLGAGTSAGRSIRTQRWRRASLRAARAWFACRRWPATTCCATRSERSRGSTFATASIARARSAVTLRACAART